MPYKRRSEGKKAVVGFAKGMAIAAVIVLAIVATSLMVRSFHAEDRCVKQGPGAAVEEPADANSEIAGKYYGLCEKNSIHSVEDFRKTVQSDPVLAAHFSGFNWETARQGRLEKEVWTFVSYRKGDTIKRTSRAIRLPRGDGFITDGTRVARTFCCNDYVIAPSPTSVNTATTDNPVERVDAPPNRPSPGNSTPPSASSQGLTSRSSAEQSLRHVAGAPPAPPYPYTRPTFRHRSSSRKRRPEKPPVVTPEPGTFFMVGTGMAYGIFSLLRRKRKSSL